ncbi:hypothetical protein AWM70_15900 [Paenibacillus yonginensis]|uniref:Uncharacterized protein n=1 Tax=Paenibacillus yonginensis TaxID=1462996 RepID=A0A1B1N3A6_9BACL|nr:hypothetical protein [Paenibacillus yonginensis]ANS75889.1 hypothetical protein AWM70_15900 [Paenibacillus yonginensis]
MLLRLSKRAQLSYAGLTYAGIVYVGLFAAGYFLHIYWRNPGLQRAALILYIVSVLYLVWRIYAKSKGWGNKSALAMIGLEVLLLLGCLSYPMLVLPWIVLVPWLASGQAHAALKVTGGLLHLPVVLLLLLLVLLIKGIVAQLTLAEAVSPDGRHVVLVKMIDSGAAGGAAHGELGTLYGPFIRTKLLYTGPYREESVVKWEGNRYFNIDGFRIDSQSGKLAAEHRK